MSTLPKTTKDISTHPAKGTVTSPNDPRLKEADVDRKFRIYGAIDALRHSKLPSNAQIDAFLGSMVDAQPAAIESLSPEGRRLVQDAKEVIRTTRTMLNEKNADEMLQNFVWRTRSLDKDTFKPGEMEVGPGGDKVQNDREQAVKHLRTIVSLVLTNSEVRKLLADFSTIGRDLLARGASNAATMLAPNPEELSNVDATAPNDQFITEGGRAAGPNETPVLEGRAPGVGGVRMHPREDEPQLWREGEQGEQGEKRPIGEVRDEMGQRVEGVTGTTGGVREHAGAMTEQAKEKMAETKDESMRQGQEIQEAREQGDEEAIEEKKLGMKGKMRQFRDTVKDGFSDRIPDKHKDAANEKFERSRKFLSEEYFPEERRDQFIFRGKKVILECQKHDDYQESIRWLLSFIEEYAKHGQGAVGQGRNHVANITSDDTFNLCVAELRTLLERFANDVSMDVIIDAINALVDDARRDQDLRQWWSTVDGYVRKVLLEPGYILEPDCNTQANKLRDSGRFFYNEKYKDHFNNFFNSIGKWFGAMAEDPINHQLGEDWARLTKDLLFDSEGSLKFKPELWNDIRKVILPSLIDQIGYIPIPRIEYSDESLDLVVENLTLQGRNLFPNIVALEANNFVKFSPYSTIEDDSRHHVKICLEQMQADMRDVAFYYRKKTGIPKMKDSGIADVVIGGHGLNATIELTSARHDPRSVFKIHAIHVKVDTLKFAIRDSNHDFLYKTLRPLATGLIKRQIQKALCDALQTGLEYLDGELVVVRNRMGAGGEEGGKVDALKEIFTRQSSHKRDTSSATSSESKSQFKIVADKRDSLLAGEGHPAGWVNRTAEIKAKARSGPGATGTGASTIGTGAGAGVGAPGAAAGATGAAAGLGAPIVSQGMGTGAATRGVVVGAGGVGGTPLTAKSDVDAWKTDAFDIGPTEHAQKFSQATRN